MSYLSRPLTLLAATAIALSGCGSDDGDSAETESAETTVAPTTSEAAGRDTETSSEADGSVVSASFEIDGRTYVVSCVAISPSNLSDPITQIDYFGSNVSIRALAGVSQDNAVAIEVDGGACSAGEQQLSDWSLATARNLENGQAQQIACDSGLKVEGC